MTINIVNLTPHDINFVDNDGNVVRTINRSGDVARVSSHSVIVDNVDGIDVCSTSFGDIQGIPDAQDNTIFIVSRICKSAVPDRDDVLCPGDAFRNDAGQVVGCKNLSR